MIHSFSCCFSPKRLTLLRYLHLPVYSWVTLPVSAVFGEDASFSCSLSDLKRASQITWQRVRKNNSIQDLATYSKMYGENVMEPKVVFMEASLNSSSIIVRNVSVEDEACYVCTFHVYPSGSVRKQTCLTVHGTLPPPSLLLSQHSLEDV
uniref:Ig-like domain-containing protein n=1 Tax=Scleropages formosus TaxID=113540 RepID=A0A8C9TV28_SCLFO